MSITHISKTEFLPAFYAAFRATMTEKHIKGGFKGAGLIPFDPESVVSKLEVQLRTPTPAEEQASQAQPWTSKTPKSIREIEFQSEYLERRLRRHQNSSPEPTLEALKSISKGTKAVIMRWLY
jgi:hypothetical protein